jgi:ion channel
VTDRNREHAGDLGPGYELFIVALTGLSLVNIVILVGPFNVDTKQVAGIIDAVLCIAFLTDVAVRLYLADPWQAYFIGRQGYLDLLGSLPLPIVRLLRIVRMQRGIVRVRSLGERRIVRRLIHERAQTALLFATFLVIFIVEIGSILIVEAEKGAPNANIRTGGDAVWWAMVTVATVGYGDKYPVTAPGRVIAVLMIISGVGLFGVFTGYVARVFLAPRPEDVPEAASQAAAPGPGYSIGSGVPPGTRGPEPPG